MVLVMAVGIIFKQASYRGETEAERRSVTAKNDSWEWLVNPGVLTPESKLLTAKMMPNPLGVWHVQWKQETWVFPLILLPLTSYVSHSTLMEAFYKFFIMCYTFKN